MRAAISLACLLSVSACPSGYPAPEPTTHHAKEPRVVESSKPEANFPKEPSDQSDEWDEFFRNTRTRRTLEFDDRWADSSSKTWQVGKTESRLSDSLDTIQRGGADGSGSGYGSSQSGGSSMSYDPELHDMGLKVGRDGKLHRVGGDARSPSDPDEGPALEWDELHRKQFGR